MAHSNPATHSSQQAVREALVFCGLLVAGVALRLYFREIPNFAPVAAIALFAGFYFRSIWMAASLPVLLMGITDVVLGGYDWRLMAVVYVMLTVPVLLRTWVRAVDPSASFQRGNQETMAARLGRVATRLLLVLGSCLACSIAFFVVTNGACWAFGNWYSKDWGGLLACYSAALPFFRYTILGDACFGLSLFGGYVLLSLISPMVTERLARSARVIG